MDKSKNHKQYIRFVSRKYFHKHTDVKIKLKKYIH